MMVSLTHSLLTHAVRQCSIGRITDVYHNFWSNTTTLTLYPPSPTLTFFTYPVYYIDLKICFKTFTESDEVKDDMKSLLELGFKGEQIKITIDEVNRQVIRDESELPTITLLYDYRPASSTVDPVLLFHG